MAVGPSTHTPAGVNGADSRPNGPWTSETGAICRYFFGGRRVSSLTISRRPAPVSTNVASMVLKPGS